MPELPDVEGFRRSAARYAGGRLVDRVEVLDHALVRNATAQRLGRALAGTRLGRPDRHGKWLVLPADGAAVLLHFGMTGLLAWTARDTEFHVHDRVVFHCRGGQLRYRNQRRLGGLWLARDQAERKHLLGELGPDALSVGPDRLEELLRGRRGLIKPTLMNQKVLAGLGNLLVDEILWRARIQPRAPVPTLGPRRLTALGEALQAVLREAMPHGRVPQAPGWLTGARGEKDARCPRCGSLLRRAAVGGRTAVWCPRCQRA